MLSSVCQEIVQEIYPDVAGAIYMLARGLVSGIYAGELMAEW